MLLINTLESNAQGKEDLTEATITIATILEIWMKVKLSLSSAVCMEEWLKENPMDMEKPCPSTAIILSKNVWKSFVHPLGQCRWSRPRIWKSRYMEKSNSNVC